MLIAVALSALAAAFALPFVMSGGDDEDVDAVSPESEGAFDDLTDLVEAPLFSREYFTVHAGEGLFELSEFRAEFDTCVIKCPDLEVAFETGANDEGIPQVYVTLANGEEMTVSFPGLSDVPGDAVQIEVPVSEVEGPVMLSLNDVMSSGTGDAAEPANPVFSLDAWDDGNDAIYDEPAGDLADLVPLAPGAGDAGDEPSDLVGELFPVAPSDPETDDQPSGGVPDVTPIGPNPATEVLGA